MDYLSLNVNTFLSSPFQSRSPLSSNKALNTLLFRSINLKKKLKIDIFSSLKGEVFGIYP
ncbi:MAG: hypothetical protein B7Y25_00720 [Alphaproteobacteria bacterium 16-39-46]|nr:MAG: hypothetical protein B7Y25_00720 [Alphaproteobacteria bacterium 16-39-46]OZA44363.1 MAG: hypothetical protein B7X84_00725 [Alphaproteobacteria bacterium 17-39-52]